MDELYKRYGQLMVNLEILNGQINECKRAIAEGLQKQGQKPVEAKPEAVSGT